MITQQGGVRLTRPTIMRRATLKTTAAIQGLWLFSESLLHVRDHEKHFSYSHSVIYHLSILLKLSFLPHYYIQGDSEMLNNLL